MTTDTRMPGRTIEMTKSGFVLEIDGRLKAEFSTKEGAEHGAVELKRRKPALQIRIYDAAPQSRHDLPVLLGLRRKGEAGHGVDYGNVAHGRAGGLIDAFGSRAPRLVAVARAHELAERRKTSQSIHPTP